MVQEAFSIVSLAKYEELCHVKSFSGFFQLSITSLYMDLQYLRSGFIPQIWAPVNYFFSEISHPGDQKKGGCEWYEGCYFFWEKMGPCCHIIRIKGPI
jgi:hypothetical protein